MIVVAVHGEDEMEVPAGLVEQTARRVLEDAGRTEAEVSVTFLDDPTIRDLNREYLGHDWATDVLSFDLSGAPGPDPEEPPPLLADLYIGAERARAQALERGLDPAEEVVRLTVHGLLHTLGHDHPDEGREESPFFVLQEQLVRSVLGGGPA